MRIKLIVATLLSLVGITAFSAVQDTYKFTMRLKVPTIIDNNQSLGKRKYKSQTITGNVYIIYPDSGSYPVVKFGNLTNKSYKIRGNNVTYTTIVYDDKTKLNYIGSNLTGKFNTPTFSVSIDANPNYNIGDDEPDNTLVVVLSGAGVSNYKESQGCRIITRLRGNVAGQLGCGCRAYDHISPTRVASACGPNINKVEDIAAIWGSFTMKWESRCDCDYEEDSQSEEDSENGN